jgi:hypothetical protein
LAIDARGRARPSWRGPWLAALLALSAAGCSDGGDEVCGPGDAPADGLTAAIPGATVTYGDVTSSPNNDCPPDEGGPTSITIEATQTGLAPGERFSMVLCLPRPDEIDAGALGAATVALDDDRLVQLIDVSARLADDCQLRRDGAMLPGGTITFAGYCDAGDAAEGYALTFDGTAAGRRICPDGMDGFTEEPVTIVLSGTVAVRALMF